MICGVNNKPMHSGLSTAGDRCIAPIRPIFSGYSLKNASESIDMVEADRREDSNGKTDMGL